jgi:phosphoribosylanthranilate isomerase
MTRVKICGLRRMADVTAVNRCKPEYAGFVFAPSRRRVTPEEAARMTAALDPAVLPVGVFAGAGPEEVARVAALCGLGAVQLHGGEDAAYIARLKAMLPEGMLLFKAVRVQAPSDLERAAGLDCDLFVLDAWHSGRMGGTGETFDWSLAEGFARPFLLAGGLHAENIPRAVKACKPLGIDVSTGAETDGFKDEAKIAAIIEAARR